MKTMVKTPLQIILALLLGSAPSEASETIYAQGEVWQVKEWLPNGPVGENDPKPACHLMSQIWNDRGLNIQYVLANRDYVAFWAQVRSTAWELPLGKKTDVTLVTMAGSVTINMTATKTTVLTGFVEQTQNGQDNYMILDFALRAMLNIRGRGAGFRVKFAGNEPAWPIPAPDPYEAYRIKTGLDKCVANLRRNASTFYPVNNGGNANGPTSPFAE